MNIDSDPFSNVRIQKNQNTNPQSVENIKSEDPFDNVRIKKAEGFPYIYETGRHAARVASRFLETIGGVPGDIQSLVRSGTFAGLEKIGLPVSEKAKKFIKEHDFPTSQELKEKSQEITGGFTKPQGSIEESIDQGVELISSLLGPMKFRKAIGVGIGSQATKEGMKLLGLGETPQEAGKLGTMIVLSALNPGGALKYSTQQFNKANQLSRGASVNISQGKTELENLLKDLQLGVETTSKNSVVKPIKQLLEKIKNDKVLVQDLTAAKRDVSSIIGEPETLSGAKKLLKGVGKIIDKSIKPYEKLNPSFSEAYRPANEIFGAVMEGNKASNFVKKTLGSKSVLGAVLGEAVLGHPEYILPTAGAAIGVHGAAKTTDFIQRLAISKELRKYYQKAIISAIKEDVHSLRKYEDKIQEVMNQSSDSRSKK